MHSATRISLGGRATTCSGGLWWIPMLWEGKSALLLHCDTWTWREHFTGTPLLQSTGTTTYSIPTNSGCYPSSSVWPTHMGGHYPPICLQCSSLEDSAVTTRSSFTNDTRLLGTTSGRERGAMWSEHSYSLGRAATQKTAPLSAHKIMYFACDPVHSSLKAY